MDDGRETTPAVAKKLRKIVAALPGGDGWTKGDSEWWFECAEQLYRYEYTFEYIQDLLQHMYNGVKAEYGD